MLRLLFPVADNKKQEYKCFIKCKSDVFFYTFNYPVVIITFIWKISETRCPPDTVPGDKPVTAELNNRKAF